MANGLHDTGEEAVIKHFFTDEISRPASVNIGLFNDSADALQDSSDYADITTEPTDGNYAPVTKNFGTSDFVSGTSSGDWQAIISDIVFDVTDTTGSVDAFYVSMSFQSQGEGSASEHLLFTAPLPQGRNLSENTELTLTGGGLSLT